MSVVLLGSYSAIRRAMGRPVQVAPEPLPAASMPVLAPKAPPAPKPATPVAPIRPATPAPSLGRDTFVPGVQPVVPPWRFTPLTPSVSRDPAAFFISQVLDARWNPNASKKNANCGPTSLAMALRALGMQPLGLLNPSDPEAWIDQTRWLMEGDKNDFKMTSDDQVLTGAVRSGARAEKVQGVKGVENALAQGKLVVVAGNPVAYQNRLSNAQYEHFNNGHFIMVSAVQGDRVTVHDPQAHIPSFEISRAELQAYMAYKNWNAGVAVWKA